LFHDGISTAEVTELRIKVNYAWKVEKETRETDREFVDKWG
jgi:hypothetical protein